MMVSQACVACEAARAHSARAKGLAMSRPFYAYRAFDIQTLKDDLARQATAIRTLLAAGQECPDAIRDFERKKARLDFLMSNGLGAMSRLDALTGDALQA
jgi:hypothetical protein